MTLQASGLITMAQINAEFSRGNNLNSYRGTGWWTDAGASGSFPAGAISFSDAYSKRASAPGTPGNDAYTKLLLHLDGAYTDVSANGLAVGQTVGSPSFSGTSKFGGQSLYLPANAAIKYNYTAAAFANMFRGDCTVDCWVYPTLATSTRPIFGKDGIFGLYFSAGKIKFEYYGDVGGPYSCISSGTYAANTWHHVALVRSGTTISCYVNGTLACSISAADDNVYTDTASKFNIGTYSGTAGGYLTGYVDEFRVSNGIARWTGNFTPPSLQYV